VTGVIAIDRRGGKMVAVRNEKWNISFFWNPTNQPTQSVHTQNPQKRIHIEVYDEIHPYIEAVIKVLAFFDGARLRLGLACLLHHEIQF
jgi:hypothetical protein